ncbi:hypothetical protein BS17DRAFT_766862 [Gyrodon lividus]|nr:hypothetical protein BS17DRAFT_766862 [Gyrodon lividus]
MLRGLQVHFLLGFCLCCRQDVMYQLQHWKNGLASVYVQWECNDSEAEEKVNDKEDRGAVEDMALVEEYGLWEGVEEDSGEDDAWEEYDSWPKFHEEDEAVLRMSSYSLFLVLTNGVNTINNSPESRNCPAIKILEWGIPGQPEHKGWGLGIPLKIHQEEKFPDSQNSGPKYEDGEFLDRKIRVGNAPTTDTSNGEFPNNEQTTNNVKIIENCVSFGLSMNNISVNVPSAKFFKPMLSIISYIMTCTKMHELNIVWSSFVLIVSSMAQTTPSLGWGIPKGPFGSLASWDLPCQIGSLHSVKA